MQLVYTVPIHSGPLERIVRAHMRAIGMNVGTSGDASDHTADS